jgi:hypothetical protein
MSRTSSLLASLRHRAKARRQLLPFAAVVALGALPCCAEGGLDDDFVDSSIFVPGSGSPSTGSPSVSYDASSTPSVTSDAGTSWTTPGVDASSSTSGLGSVGSDAGSSRPDASSSTGKLDAGKDSGSAGGLDIASLGGLLGGLFGDAGAPPKDASGPHTDGGEFTPPPSGGGTWKLNPGSFVDCPPEPPPIPIIGGLCAGIYYGCGWTNQSGQQYSCICDWVHWLCI